MRPYFDEFLKEAGKDHYNILKRTVKRIYSMIKTKYHSNKNDNFHFIIRVRIQPLHCLDFIIPDDKNIDEYEKIFESLCDQIKIYLNKYENFERKSKPDSELEELNKNCLIYDDKNSDWKMKSRLHDDQ